MNPAAALQAIRVLQPAENKAREIVLGLDSLSHTFADGEKLLHAGAKRGLEGIVRKMRSAPYIAAPDADA